MLFWALQYDVIKMCDAQTELPCVNVYRDQVNIHHVDKAPDLRISVLSGRSSKCKVKSLDFVIW